MVCQSKSDSSPFNVVKFGTKIGYFNLLRHQALSERLPHQSAFVQNLRCCKIDEFCSSMRPTGELLIRVGETGETVCPLEWSRETTGLVGKCGRMAEGGKRQYLL